jgi:perosamine synthetase
MPTPDIRIPLSAPDITEAEIDRVSDVLRSRFLSQGETQKTFEARFAQRIGVAHAVAVSSGTAGLHLALVALGVGSGDEVITAPFAVPATANAIRLAGARPVFADINREDLNLSVVAAAAAVGPRTRAILAVHTFGLPADMPALRAVARSHGVALLEDACEGLGATLGDHPLGSLGDCGVFGFYPNKQITTGEGGMVVSRDRDLARLVRTMRNHGREDPDAWLNQTRAGFNYRLSEIACALGLAQLERLEDILARREAIAGRYRDNLAELAAIELPHINRHGRHSWFVFAIRLAAPLDAAARDRMVKSMADRGIQCGRYFAPLHLQPAAAAENHGRFPVTESVSERMLALPFFNRITDAQIDEVCETLIKLLDRLN